MRAELKPRIPTINELVRYYQNIEKPYMEKAIRAYFALDHFPDNANRYPISYGELFSAAHRRL